MKTITIQGAQFEINEPYSEGHECSANEAAALNQLLAENARNNLAKAVSEGLKAEKPHEEIQTLVTNYVAEYEFGVRRGGARIVDPVQRMAMSIAKESVKKALLEKGYKNKDLTNEIITNYAEEAIKTNPNITKLAQKRLKEQESIAIDNLPDAPPVEQAAAE